MKIRPELWDLWYLANDFDGKKSVITDDLKKVIKNFEEKGFNVLSIPEKVFDEKEVEIGGRNLFAVSVPEFIEVGYNAIYVHKK